MSLRLTLLRWFVATAVFLGVSAWSLRDYHPPLPSPLTLDLEVDRVEPGRSEPIITSGRKEAGEFLFVRHAENDSVSFGYEMWGEPGRFSPPIKMPANRRLRLVIEMPALTQVRGSFAPPAPRLRVVADGVEAFNVDVHHFVRLPTEIYFAENPIGGTACAAKLGGHLTLPDGRELRGIPTPLFGPRARLAGWLFISRWPALSALLLGVLTFHAFGRLQRRRDLASAEQETSGGLVARLKEHRHFVGVAIVCTLPFTWMVTYGSMNFVYPEVFGSFYDYQAECLLQGRLDVPWEAIGGEAFVFNGKNYGYFGVTPALLRFPLVVFGLQFGLLSRAFMVLYFVATLIACYLLLRTVRKFFIDDPETPPPWATWAFIGGIGLGSTLFYLGARAYVYHEAILCGVMFAIFGTWCALRHFAAPERRWWIGSLLCGVLSVHARPPTGFFALTFLGAMALAVILSRGRERGILIRRQIMIGVACGIGVFTFNLLSYAKFRTFEGCPLRYNVQYDAKRLARIDGKQFHLVNLPIAIDHYLVRPNFHLEAGFPYFFIGRVTPEREWQGTKIDYHDKTLGFPYAMPGLFALATIGGCVTFLRFPARRLLVGACWGAAVPMTLAMFTAIAITHRYTADFCPALFCAAAFGLVAIESAAGTMRAWARGALLLATGISVLTTFAITLHHQRQEVWGVPGERRDNYNAWRHRIDATVGRVFPKLKPAVVPAEKR